MNIHFSFIHRLLVAVLCLLSIGIQPIQGQVKARRDRNPNEIRSGRTGVDFGDNSRSRYGRRGSEYRSKRNNSLFDDSNNSGKWFIGLAAGASYNWQTREAGYAYDMTFKGAWGASAGVSGGFQFFEWLTLRADVLFTQKNYGMQRMLPILKSSNIHTDYTNHYLQVPVMVDWTFGTLVKSHIYTGGYGAFWLGGNTERISIYSEEKQKSPYTFSTEDNRGDGGWVGGVGVSYDPLPSLRLSAEMLLFYSLTNTVKKQPVMNDTRYNNTITLGITAKYIL